MNRIGDYLIIGALSFIVGCAIMAIALWLMSFSSPSSEVGVGTLPASTLYDPNSNVYVERKQK